MGEPNQALFATWRRWAAVSAALGASLVALAVAAIGFAGLHRSVASLAGPIAIGTAIGSLLVLGALRAEESRLTRELRVARAGTPVTRESAAARRDRTPLVARFLSTDVGLAAVLLADGDRAAATALLDGAPVLTRGGRLDRLRAVVRADGDRAAGTAESRARCVERLREAEPLGHREADRYRTHVLAKAVLELGDAGAALDLAGELRLLPDDDERVYATWLRVWFELDGGDGDDAWPPPSEADLRLALLLARAHGADDLVDKLQARLERLAS